MDLESGEARALLGLMLTPGLGPTLVGRCVEAFGSAEAARGGDAARLGEIKGIAAGKAGQLRRRIDETFASGAVDRELEAVARARARLLHRDDAEYPQLLRHIPDPPLLLWVRGELRRGDGLALGVVGSRKCSLYGREQADRLAAHCGSAGLCIVSGGAYGIDVAAHRAALRVGARTVAVIGSGLGKPYPAEHVPLFREIAGGGDGQEVRGAVISELPMQTGPAAQNFPRRNRIISGMSLGVLVVEAAKRSGALITARLCVEEHGRECMAVPGRVDSPGSAGCHRIIREGWATLVTSAAEVLDQLGEAGRLLKQQWENPDVEPTATKNPGQDSPVDEPSAAGFDATLTETQRQVVAVLKENGGGCSLDQVVAATGLGVGQAMAELTLLEVRGVVVRRGGLYTPRR